MNSLPEPTQFEHINCWLCGCDVSNKFIQAEDDLTGKPGRFQFERCAQCQFTFQNPRLKFEHIGAWYNDEYISHRKKTDWGLLTPFYQRAMGKHDRDKLALVQQYVSLNSSSTVLDIGCGSGSFLQHVKETTGASVSGVDFKDLTQLPTMQGVDFRHGTLAEQTFEPQSFDLITMWHFLEHDYEAKQTLETARTLLKPTGRIVIEVPSLDSLTFRMFKDRWPGLQAPQHTALFSRTSLRTLVESANIQVDEQLDYGAFPPYFYLFAGCAFKWLKGRGLNLQKAILPYFIGQVLSLPFVLLMKKRNLAMQSLIGRSGEQ